MVSNLSRLQHRQKLFQSVFWKSECRKSCSAQRAHDLAGEFPLQNMLIACSFWHLVCFSGLKWEE